MVDRITQACGETGSYTLTVGTMQPALVVRRLLAALAVLDPETHGEITGGGGGYGTLLLDALRDELNEWWESEQAETFIDSLIGAINDAAPKGFVCSWCDTDRLELVPFNPPFSERVGPERSAPPPHMSTLRKRVNSRS